MLRQRWQRHWPTLHAGLRLRAKIFLHLWSRYAIVRWLNHTASLRRVIVKNNIRRFLLCWPIPESLQALISMWLRSLSSQSFLLFVIMSLLLLLIILSKLLLVILMLGLVVALMHLYGTGSIYVGIWVSFLGNNLAVLMSMLTLLNKIYLFELLLSLICSN